MSEAANSEVGRGVPDCTVYAGAAADLLRDRMGCCLHVVICDPNDDNTTAQHCLERAVEANHPRCIALAEAVLRMTRTQRKKLRGLAVDMAWGTKPEES